jgi:hypothetical protein
MKLSQMKMSWNCSENFLESEKVFSYLYTAPPKMKNGKVRLNIPDFN